MLFTLEKSRIGAIRTISFVFSHTFIKRRAPKAFDFRGAWRISFVFRQRNERKGVSFALPIRIRFGGGEPPGYAVFCRKMCRKNGFGENNLLCCAAKPNTKAEGQSVFDGIAEKTRSVGRRRKIQFYGIRIEKKNGAV